MLISVKNILHFLTLKCYVLIIIIISAICFTFPQAKFDDYYIHIRGYFYAMPVVSISKNNSQDTGKETHNTDLNSDAHPDTLQKTQEAHETPESLPDTFKKIIETPFEYGGKSDSQEGLWNILKNNLKIDQNDNNIEFILYQAFGYFLIIFVILFYIVWILFKKSILTHSRAIILFGLLFLYSGSAVLLSFFKEDYLKKNYISPDFLLTKTIHPKKNLIVIYVESLEKTFSNKKVFNEDILKPLETIGGISMPLIPNKGTTNTLSGVFSALCSYPFYAAYSSQDEALRQKLYLNKKICLGNVLNFHQYEQHSVHGSRSSYSFNRDFKRVFYKNQIPFHDCQELKKQGYPIYYPSFDGCFHNQEVLDETEVYLKRLHKNKDKKFHLSNFLLDTHTPDGFFSKDCLDSEKNDSLKIRGSFKCAIRMLKNKLVRWKDKGLLEDTVVVIVGDHPFMPNWTSHKYFQVERSVYFHILGYNQNKLSPKRQYMNHFDIMPTILDALEMLPEAHHKVGLGSSIFREDKEFDERQKHLKNEYYLFSDI